MEKIGRVKAIMRFFSEGEYGRKVTMEEMKSLTQEDRADLGAPCAAALGCELAASE